MLAWHWFCGILLNKAENILRSMWTTRPAYSWPQFSEIRLVSTPLGADKMKKTYFDDFDVTFFAFKWIEQPALWNLQCWGFISAQCGLHLNSGNSWKLILPPNWFNGVDWYYFERIAFREKKQQINSASSGATKQQPTSTATATKTL